MVGVTRAVVTSPHTPDAPDAVTSDVTFSKVAFANATSTLLLFGAVSSLMGPLLVSFSHRFHISLPSAGAVLSVYFVGAFVGVPLGYLGVTRYRGHAVLVVMMLVGALGAAVAALSRHWSELLVGIFVIGVSFGGVDFTLNTLLVRTDAQGRGHRLSVVNAGYGVGAVLGPVAIIIIHPSRFAWLFAAVAVIAVLVSLFYRRLYAPPMRSTLHPRSLVARGRRRSVLLSFVAAYVLYVCAESSASGWIAPQLHQVGYSQPLASAVTAGFWGALAIGRVVAGPMAARWSERLLVLGGLALATCLSAAAFFDAAAPITYPILGLVIASVYPMGLIWYTSLCPGDGDGLSALILCMMIGGILGPGTESLVVSLSGIHAVPLVVAAFFLADFAVFASLRRFDTPGGAAAAP